jgi:acetyl-CoA carboxylase biotin carboxyl carrier protein
MAPPRPADQSPPAREPAEAGGGPDEPVGEILDHVREHALRLLDDVTDPPTALRVRAGEVTVDLEWGAGAAGAPATVPAPAVQPPAGPDGAQPAAGPGPDATPAGAGPEPDAAGYLVAPTVGVFYRAPEPGADPFVAEGDTVAAGQQVGIVEAMKLMIPVEAGQAGRIARALKQDGEPVEYDEPLFALEPAEPAEPAGTAGEGDGHVS